MWKKILIGCLLAGLIYAGYRWKLSNKTNQISYQTSVVERGTLVAYVSASGLISGTNISPITTTTTGIVDKVYVKDGQKIYAGQILARLQPDLASKQKQISSYAAYLAAKNQLQNNKDRLNSLQSAAFKANQKFINDAVARNLSDLDPTYIQEKADWLQAEADYKNQSSAIAQSQTSLQSNYLDYQSVSSNILSPGSGTLVNFALEPGITISTSGQKIGAIKNTLSKIQATVNLSESDVGKVLPGEKVTFSLDAIANKTFTGKVLAIDTTGTSSSGVVSYPCILVFDDTPDGIYANMAVTAKIITNVVADALLVPNKAVTTNTSTGTSTVKILQNNQVQNQTVEVGINNDTQTQIISGISEGQSVITSTSSTNTTTSTNTSSPFGGVGIGGGGGQFRNLR